MSDACNVVSWRFGYERLRRFGGLDLADVGQGFSMGVETQPSKHDFR
jgi:hypothetical protein